MPKNTSAKISKKVKENLITLVSEIARKKVTIEGKFSLDDLCGKKIEKHLRVGNPTPIIPSIQPFNPPFFEVQKYDDGTFLLSDSFGSGGCKKIDFYYHDGKKVYYSDNLFG